MLCEKSYSLGGQDKMKINPFIKLIVFMVALTGCAATEKNGYEISGPSSGNNDQWSEIWNQRSVVFADDVENETQRDILHRQNERLGSLEKEIGQLREQQNLLMAAVDNVKKPENTEILTEKNDQSNNDIEQQLREKIGLHVASYQDAKIARQVAGNFEKILEYTINGKRSHVERIIVSEQEYYRVIFGPYPDRSEAEKVCQKIREDIGFCATVAYAVEPIR